MRYQEFILDYNDGEDTLTLEINPDGWDKNGQSWQRDGEYYGIFQSYTVETYRFFRTVNGGGDFIAEKFELDDLKTKISISVYLLNHQTNDYDLSYTGILNFDPDKFSIEKDYVDIGFVQSGDMQKFITREDLELDINKRISVDGVTMDELLHSNLDILFKTINIFRTLESNGNLKDEFYFGISDNPPFNPSSRRVGPGNNVLVKYYPENIIENELGEFFTSDLNSPNLNCYDFIWSSSSEFTFLVSYIGSDTTYNDLVVSDFTFTDNVHGLVTPTLFSVSGSGRYSVTFSEALTDGNININTGAITGQTLYEYDFETGTNFQSRSQYIYVNESDATTNLFIDNCVTTDFMIWRITRYNSEEYDAQIHADLKVIIYNEEDVIISEDIIDTYFWELSATPGRLNPYIEIFTLQISSITGNTYVIPPGYKWTVVIDTYTNVISEWHVDNWAQLLGKFTFILNLTETIVGAPDTNVKSWLPDEAFTRLFQLITSKENKFYSEFLGRENSTGFTYTQNGEGSLDAITSGWNIRQFLNKPLTLKLKDLFRQFSAMYCLGMSYDMINERFYIAPMAEFYNSELIMFDIGEVDKLVIRPYKKAYVNEISGGSDNEGEYESLNGIKEYQTQTKWNTDQPVKDILEIRAPYNTDSIGMTFAGLKNVKNFASEDTDYDDLIYIVRTDGEETLQGGNSLSGFKGIDQYYNIPLSPRENLLRWGRFLKAEYWKEDDYTIKFSKGKKAINITYQNQNGDIVEEFQDISANEIPDLRYFNPQMYEFSGRFKDEYASTLRTNPHGQILFSFIQQPFAGFIDELQTEDYQRKAEYKLIAYNRDEAVDKVYMDDDPALFMDNDTHQFM